MYVFPHVEGHYYFYATVFYTRDMTQVSATQMYEEAAREVLQAVDAEIQALLEEAARYRSVADAETQDELAQVRARLFGTDA